MMRAIYVFQPLLQNVRIDLGCGYVAMTQHELNRSQVGAPLKQVRGEGMADGMRRQRT